MKIIKTAKYKKLARTTPAQHKYIMDTYFNKPKLSDMDQEVDSLARDALALMGGGRGFEAEVAINEVIAKEYRGQQIPAQVEPLKGLIRQKIQELQSGMTAI